MNSKSIVRSACLRSLSEHIAVTEVCRAVRKALHDEDYLVRAEAAIALGPVAGDKDVQQALTHIVASECEEEAVRKSAAKSLAKQCLADQFIQQLTGVFNSSAKNEQLLIAEALSGSLAKDSALDFFVDLAVSQHIDLRQNAVEAISQYPHHPKVQSILAQHLVGDDAFCRRQAILSLWKMVLETRKKSGASQNALKTYSLTFVNRIKFRMRRH